MKNNLLSALVVLSLVFAMSCKNSGGGKAVLKTKMDSVSYVVGTILGHNVKSDTTIKFTSEALIKGLKDCLEGKDSLVFKEVDKQKIMMAFEQEIQKKKQEKMAQASGPNKKKGADFLAENKKKDGIKETASGLQYKVVKQGKGKKPAETDVVKVNYEGRLIDGKVFDSSYQRKEPATFALNGVIKGWIEGLQLMSEGSEFELYIPSDLAYGDMGNQLIPGGSTLIFKVELIKVMTQKEAQEEATKGKK